MAGERVRELRSQVLVRRWASILLLAVVLGTLGVGGAVRSYGSTSDDGGVAPDRTLREAVADHDLDVASLAEVTGLLTSDRCMACHNGMTTSEGETLSFGVDWRTSMMANSARDPYWKAAVRREVTDHPQASAHIQSECSRCHLPVASETAHALGTHSDVFDTLSDPTTSIFRVASDGVSCTVCHRIEPESLEGETSFNGGFSTQPVAAQAAQADQGTPHPIYGPYEIEDGFRHLMQSAVDHEPRQSDHIRSSELCASCHTLITQTLGAGGEALGSFPEQVPYLEWLASDYGRGPAQRSCQSCHMPEIESAPITSVLGEPRERPRRHVFRGGNFFMQKLLGRYAEDLGVAAPPAEFEAAAEATREHLGTASAEIEFAALTLNGCDLRADLVVRNLAGHKLPTAYPSRRAWIEFVVRDASGRTLFHSGAMRPDGAIAGNDNDEDGTRFEPHHTVITAENQVQIYEPILGDSEGAVTTGLLRAAVYLKDNRLLPRGFDKASVEDRVAVHGAASHDDDFDADGDRIIYAIDLAGTTGPYEIEAVLRYQPIGFRWAQNLRPYTDAQEPAAFLRYYEALAAESSTPLARAVRTVE